MCEVEATFVQTLVFLQNVAASTGAAKHGTLVEQEAGQVEQARGAVTREQQVLIASCSELKAACGECLERVEKGVIARLATADSYSPSTFPCISTALNRLETLEQHRLPDLARTAADTRQRLKDELRKHMLGVKRNAINAIQTGCDGDVALDQLLATLQDGASPDAGAANDVFSALKGAMAASKKHIENGLSRELNPTILPETFRQVQKLKFLSHALNAAPRGDDAPVMGKPTAEVAGDAHLKGPHQEADSDGSGKTKLSRPAESADVHQRPVPSAPPLHHRNSETNDSPQHTLATGSEALRTALELEQKFAKHVDSTLQSLLKETSLEDCFSSDQGLWVTAVSYVCAVDVMDVVAGLPLCQPLNSFCAEVKAMLMHEHEVYRLDLAECKAFMSESCIQSQRVAEEDVFFDAEEAMMITAEGNPSSVSVDLPKGNSGATANPPVEADDGAAKNLQQDPQHVVSAMLKCLRAMKTLVQSDFQLSRVNGDMIKHLIEEPKKTLKEWCGAPGAPEGLLFEYYSKLAKHVASSQGENADARAASSPLPIHQLHTNRAVVKLLAACDPWVESFDAGPTPFADLGIRVNKEIHDRETDAKQALQTTLKDFDLDRLEDFKDKPLEPSTVVKISSCILKEAFSLQALSKELKPADTQSVKDMFGRCQYLSSRTSKVQWCFQGGGGANELAEHMESTQQNCTRVLHVLLDSVRLHVNKGKEFVHAEKTLKIVGGLLNADPAQGNPFADVLPTLESTRQHVDQCLTGDQLNGLYAARCCFVLLENPTAQVLDDLRGRDGLLIFVASAAQAPSLTSSGSVHSAASSLDQAQGKRVPRLSGSTRNMHADGAPPTQFTHAEWVDLRDHLYRHEDDNRKRRKCVHAIAKAMNTLQEDYGTRMKTVGKKGTEVAELFAVGPNNIMELPWMKNSRGGTVTALYKYIDVLKTNGSVSPGIVSCLHRLRILGNNARNPSLSAFTVR